MTTSRPMFPPPLAAAPAREFRQLAEFPQRRQLALDASIDAPCEPSANLPKITDVSDREPLLRKTDEKVVFSDVPIGAPSPRAVTGRRGFLRGLAAFLPLTAVAAQIAPAPAAAGPVAENPKLLRMGVKIEALEQRLIVVLTEREKARVRCRAMWPELPDEIVFRGDVHYDFDGRLETNEDDKPISIHPKRATRQIVTVISLQDAATGDGRLRSTKFARRLLPIADQYETARLRSIEESGYRGAKMEASGVGYKIELISDAISKCECLTFTGLYWKARALQITIMAGSQVNEHTAFRAKLLHAEIMARDIIGLRGAI